MPRAGFRQDADPPEEGLGRPARGRGRGRAALRRLGLLYLLLLAASTVVRLARDDAPRPRPGERVVRVAEVDGGAPTGREIALAYTDRGPADGTAPVILALHGSPGSAHDFDRVGEPLAERFRVVAPSLPGFGSSERDVADYSIDAHALYALELLDALGIERAHVLGFSMGGGVAWRLEERAPERVASVTMLSGLGVQELELFGDHRMNRAVHGLQLAAVQAALWLLPHFGALDDAMLGRPYARNFYDSDQRPLRATMERAELPVLVVHGERDFLVPPEAAREHARILPQAELELLPASHFLPWTDAPRVAHLVADFVDRVEHGGAVTRATADAERIAAAAAPWDPTAVPRAAGFALVVLVLLIALATLVSEDLTCIGVGLMVAEGRIGFLAGTLGCFAGILLGDVLLYLAGRWLGRAAIARAPLRWFVSEAAVERASRWFEKRGRAVIFLSRFTPGLRLPTYVAAGVVRTSFWAFAFYFTLACALWTPLLVGFASLVGVQAREWLGGLERWALPGLVAIAVAILGLERLVVPLFTFRGRRLLLGGLRRKLRWEFWPRWAFYPPVVAYVAWLALKHRSLALVTAANPALPAGGVIGESKSAILDALAHAGELVARHRLLPAGAGAEALLGTLRAFLRDEGLDYPLVLKPDVGQRGDGVRVVRDEAAARRYLERVEGDTIAQEYVPGLELGVFYYRFPDEERGHVLSVTEKRMPVLVGDGESDLERLILLDERAVALAEVYCEANAERLNEVPAKGERVQLVDLGTHCRGAVFLDGAHLAPPALVAAIDRVSRGFEGFYFGRYDLRVHAPERLDEGRGFKLLELNGLTSEAAHLYDPKHRLRDAYRILFEQWRIAFEVARRNRERGVEPARLRDVLRELFAYRGAARP